MTVNSWIILSKASLKNQISLLIHNNSHYINTRPSALALDFPVLSTTVKKNDRG